LSNEISFSLGVVPTMGTDGMAHDLLESVLRRMAFLERLAARVGTLHERTRLWLELEPALRWVPESEASV
jgi:hypothetical protein